MKRIVILLACVLAVHPTSARQARSGTTPVTLDTLLAAYRGGDADVFDRTFTRPRDFQTILHFPELKDLDSWLRTWDRGKAVALLEISRVASRVAPQYASIPVRAGRRYVSTAKDNEQTAGQTAAFVGQWHAAAIGLLESIGNPAVIDEHLDALKGNAAPTGTAAARLPLARAIAQERRCWDARPTLDLPSVGIDGVSKAAGAPVRGNLNSGPAAARAEIDAYRKCLGEAFPRFEAAAAMDEARAEAHVRGGWILFQQGRPDDALAWLEPAKPGSDGALAYWLNLFRGRILGGLGRNQDAADAYRSALILYPGAHSAGTGLALELFRLDQAAEADRAARELRRSPGPDPWSQYYAADGRFVGAMLAQLWKAGA